MGKAFYKAYFHLGDLPITPVFLLKSFAYFILLGYGVRKTRNMFLEPEQVRTVVLETAESHPDVLSVPPPEVIFTGFGDSSLDFELRVWTITRVQVPRILRSEIYFMIFKAFKEHGMEISFPQRDLHLRSVDSPIPVRNMG